MKQGKIILLNLLPTILSLFHIMGELPYPWVLLYYSFLGYIPILAFLLGGIYCILIDKFLFKLPLGQGVTISSICVTLNIVVYGITCLASGSFDTTIFVLLAVQQYTTLLLAWAVISYVCRHKTRK